MSRTIIRDCRVWDGSGKAAFPADLLIEGGRIRAVARNRGQLDDAGAEVIEAGGMTLMLLDGSVRKNAKVLSPGAKEPRIKGSSILQTIFRAGP